MSQPRAASEKISLDFTGDDTITFRSPAEIGATATATTVKPKKRPPPPPRPTHSKNHSFYRAALLPYLFVIAYIPLIKYTDHRFAKIEARIEELKSELENHAADGLGRVDYAMAASGVGGGGGTVVEHSEPYFRDVWYFLKGGGVQGDAVKMLRPSFGEPGACFCLKGYKGFVHIKLRSPIVPEAVTLEHVHKSVAYDRSRTSAPKDCKVFGWFDIGVHDTTDASAEREMHLLTEFTYDLGKSNVQTFNVSYPKDNVDGVLVDMIRLEFSSNHGSSLNTCIYRLRVHGFRPSANLFTRLMPKIWKNPKI